MTTERCPICGDILYPWKAQLWGVGVPHKCKPSFIVSTEDPRVGEEDEEWFLDGDPVFADGPQAAAFSLVERMLSTGDWGSDQDVFVMPLDGEGELYILRVTYEMVPSFSVLEEELVAWRPRDLIDQVEGDNDGTE